MVEPTESETLEEIDRFCDAMINIAPRSPRSKRGSGRVRTTTLVNAPHTQAQVTSEDWDHPYRGGSRLFQPGCTQGRSTPRASTSTGRPSAASTVSGIAPVPHLPSARGLRVARFSGLLTSYVVDPMRQLDVVLGEAALGMCRGGPASPCSNGCRCQGDGSSAPPRARPDSRSPRRRQSQSAHTSRQSPAHRHRRGASSVVPPAVGTLRNQSRVGL